MVSLHIPNIGIHEPMPWAIFEKSIQFEPITLENFIEILSKKDNIFVEDDHRYNFITEHIVRLLPLLPDYLLYLECTPQTMEKTFFLPPNCLTPFKNRCSPVYESERSYESYPMQQKMHLEEEEIKKRLLNKDKKIIFIGGWHIRPGNGVHTYTPDLSKMVTIYTDSLNKTPKSSKYNHAENSEEIFGFEIFKIN